MRSKWMIFRGFRTLTLAAAALALIAAAGAPALSAPAADPSPRINDLVVVEKKGQLLVFGSFESAFSPQLFEVVQSGVTTRFVYEVGLVRSRWLLYDAEIATRSFVHQVKYDALKKAYTFNIIRNPDEGTQRITQSRQEMIDWMTEVNGAPIAQVKNLDPGASYYVRIRAKVNSVNFAFPFNYLLAFLGKQTPWAFSHHFGQRGM